MRFIVNIDANSANGPGIAQSLRRIAEYVDRMTFEKIQNEVQENRVHPATVNGNSVGFWNFQESTQDEASAEELRLVNEAEALTLLDGGEPDYGFEGSD